MLRLIGLLILSVYLMWKREIPFFFHIKLIGSYFIVSAILLLSHVTLFHLLTNNGNFKNPSVISKYMGIIYDGSKRRNKHTDLGGGMIGAVLFALFHYLICRNRHENYCFYLYHYWFYFTYRKIVW